MLIEDSLLKRSFSRQFMQPIEAFGALLMKFGSLFSGCKHHFHCHPAMSGGGGKNRVTWSFGQRLPVNVGGMRKSTMWASISETTGWSKQAPLRPASSFGNCVGLEAANGRCIRMNDFLKSISEYQAIQNTPLQLFEELPNFWQLLIYNCLIP